MTILTREQILAADDRHTETVEIPEWGGSVIVKTLTGREKDAWEMSMLGPDNKLRPEDVRARLLSVALVDEDGKRIFTDRDIAALSAKSCAAMERAVTVAKKLNALTEDDMKELAKNSGSDPGESSSSD